MQIIEVDYIVVGAGVAGLSCALEASKTGTVALLTKDKLPSGNTPLAQGGIAVVLSEKDQFDFHIEDTLIAGAGACNRVAVETLVKEGQARVLDLLDMGFPCDRDLDGKPLLSREGAHSMPRVISAWGDESGRALAETLAIQVHKQKNIFINEHTFAIDLIVQNDRCVGLIAFDLKSNKPILYAARAVVLATGGCGQLFAHTTNNIHCTGDGFALAYRAGAKLENMEFVQFHPTALDVDENPMFLVSEAVRGEGAVLINNKGERFMASLHPLAELAPRDIVARGIFSEINAGNRVYLDASPIGSEFAHRFPSISKACRDRGLHPPGDLIPVVPAAHFIMGGVKTDLDGRTTVKGLYACGEVASTGVHGANRLASNSLLEGLVFGCRAGRAVVSDKVLAGLGSGSSLAVIEKASNYVNGIELTADKKLLLEKLRKIMWEQVGLVRTGKGLSEALACFVGMEKSLGRKDLMLKNLITVAGLIARGALARKESRGSHFRTDFPPALNDYGHLQHVCSL
ncbi:L-aspartate oxidase [Desulfotruncus alcoholivorax]|uniref:L-aspartate oxidase n=1 Tax=Desulfotruncus alcoholivorax TaxID=265477 RepID=UPI000400DB8A|nr:L-aspartate oxidase [Desulfotruncus alcoholivorax]